MPTNAQLIERYTQLIRVMRKLTRHERTRHLNMHKWGIKTECGTQMCAAGFCGTDTWFKRRGFSIVPDGLNAGELTVSYKRRGSRRLDSWHALREFFGDRDDLQNNMDHPVFGKPDTYGEVIRAAQTEIRELKAAEKEAA